MEPEVNISGELVRDDLPWIDAYNDPASTEYQQLAQDTCKNVSSLVTKQLLKMFFKHFTMVGF